MTEKEVYSLSDATKKYYGGDHLPVNILTAAQPDEISEGTYSEYTKYVYRTAQLLAQEFDNINVERHDVYRNNFFKPYAESAAHEDRPHLSHRRERHGIPRNADRFVLHLRRQHQNIGATTENKLCVRNLSGHGFRYADRLFSRRGHGETSGESVAIHTCSPTRALMSGKSTFRRGHPRRLPYNHRRRAAVRLHRTRGGIGERERGSQSSTPSSTATAAS